MTGPAKISPVEAQRLAREEGAVIVDVRTPVEFSAVAAEGARLWPLDRIPKRATSVNLIEAGLPAGTPLLLICRSGARACTAAARLTSAHADIRVVEGGTAAWAAAGLPVLRSERGAISLERQVRIAAGFLVLSGTLAGIFLSPLWFAVPLFVSSGLIFAGVTDWCGMGLLLARAPWNRSAK